MNTQTRSEIIAKFKEEVKNGKILVGVGAGTGITAKSSEAGGADMLIIYNSGRYRMAGRGSLAGLLSYGDANQIVVEMGAEVLPVVKHTPVLAGVCGTDPFRVMDVYLRQLKAQGFNGVQNFPTVGLIDGVFRQNLEETGMGYGLEVEMIRKAHELDMLTCPYVFDPEQAKAMAEAGADILVAHMGLTTKGTIGAKTALTLDDCVDKIKAIIAAGRSVRPTSWSSATADLLPSPMMRHTSFTRFRRSTVSSAHPPSSVLPQSAGSRHRPPRSRRSPSK